MSIESPKSKQAEDRLPEDLKPVYKRMVEEYLFLTTLRYGKGYVAYELMADMVLAGWRPSAESHKDSKI